MKKPGEFPQGTQRIARIGEISEPNAYVLEPAPPASELIAPPVDGQVSDAELASAIIGNEAPYIARSTTKRVASAYSTETVVDVRPILTVA
ncbi:MAG: hypothetical protein ACKV2T_38160 [Kofleriaceae bacterium]